MRSSVGTGYVLTDIVRALGDCQPIPRATVELWLAGPNGYGDNGRGRLWPVPVSLSVPARGEVSPYPHEGCRGRFSPHPNRVLPASRHGDRTV